MSCMRGSVRWAFKFGSWKPTQEEWTLAAQCIQPEEKQRIGKFMFKKDSKSAMSGRLLLRKVISESLSIPYKEVKLARTEKGKPYLTNETSTEFPNFNFNVSHQGDYAVLAAEPCHQVGIDVMKVEYPRGPGGVRAFFNTMARQFTYYEWKTIRSTSDEYEQISRFYRFWCLKESYVKALGIGIGFDLQRLSFNTPTLTLSPEVIAMDTKVYVDDEVQTDWKFQETKLDDKHYIAVALQINKENDSSDLGQSSFTELSFEELTKGAEALSDPDDIYWTNFDSRMERPGSQS